MTARSLSETNAAAIVKGHLTDHGLNATPADVTRIAGAVQAATRFDLDKGETWIVNEAGDRVEGTVPGLLARLTAGLPKQTATSNRGGRAEPTHPTSRSPFAGRTDPFAKLARGFEAARVQAQVAKAHEYAKTNPWLPGRINRTAQAMISNLLPDLAAQFKQEAGVTR